MTSLGIHRDDLEEEFVRGAGAGGQKINKTSSTVRLRHVPSNIEVRCQEERSLTQNRYLAREALCERLEKRKAEALQSTRAAVARKRRQQVKRSKGVKAGMVRDKRQRGNVKALRKRPSAED
jgi:protein subunit release factor B